MRINIIIMNIKSAIITVLVGIIGYFIGTYTTTNVIDLPPTKIDNKVIDNKKEAITPQNTDIKILWETWDELSKNYYYADKMDKQTQVYGMVEGLVNSLDDPHTTFLSPDKNKEFHEAMSGDLEGIGAEVGYKNGNLVVIRPLKDSPAEKSGIRAGDIIIAIDDAPVQGISLYDAIKRIRGKKNTSVKIVIARAQTGETKEIEVIRDSIKISNVEWEMKGDIAYIQLLQFGSEVVSDLQNITSEVLLQSPKGIILDLRNNNGGLLDACLTVSSKFIEKQLIVKTKGRNALETGEMYSTTGGPFIHIPLIVLTNEGTASAAEILAGAVQDHKRGVIIGTKTFGKGSVQHVIPLSDGSSLKVTVAEWLTPKDRQINEIGITPDIVITPTEEDYKAERDVILEKALSFMNSDEMNTMLKNE